MQSENVIVGLLFVLEDWPTDDVFIPAKWLCFDFHAILMVLLHELLIILPADGLAVHLLKSFVKKFGSAAEHDWDISDHSFIVKLKSEMLDIIQSVTYSVLTFYNEQDLLDLLQVSQDNVIFLELSWL